MAKTTKGKPHPHKLNTVYDINGENLKRKNISCPKCGPGVFMAKHKNRSSCGKCGYTEFSKKEWYLYI